MQNILLLLLSAVCSFSLFAKPVNKEKASIVGSNYLQSTTTLILIHTENARFLPDTAIIPLYYIFNDQENKRFVIVAGDDASTPILAYSRESLFIAENIGSNVAKWLESYERELRFIVKEKIPSTDQIKSEWDQLLNTPAQSALQGEAVTPLLKTKWNQGQYYNTLCPYDYGESARSVTGCVATAMAQIMKYWDHPKKGVGSHSYVHSKYGSLSANFSITNYNWSNMPNQVTSSNNDVATLMYHCGVSVEMGYSPSSSGAYVTKAYSPQEHCSEYAFVNYFDYSSSTIGLIRSDYSESEWIAMLKTELDLNRPLMYTGHGSGGGHAFVCDGYDANNYFHFNWGWGGLYDGYFKVSSLNPGTGGTGGGSGNFNQYQSAIFNLEPNPQNNNPTMELEFYAPLTINPSPILVEGSYTLNFNVVNKSTEPFKGDIIGVLIDENYDIVNVTSYYTETNGLPYDYHYTQNRLFTGTLADTVLPGVYYAVILAKPLGGSWGIVNNGSYSNFVSVTVTTDNNIVMYKPYSISPLQVTENQPVSANFDVTNTGGDFQGDFSLDLHTSEGVWIKTIGELTDKSLPNNYHFTNGLTFSSSNGFGVSAGTYQLVAWSKPTGGQWEKIKSSGQNVNPIKIVISKPELTGDQFESNNTKATATRIPYTTQQDYSYSTAYTSLHNTTDVDYYKVDLPAGASYFINARIQDGFDNNNGKTYTVDAMWDYSIGNLTSDPFDDVNTDGSIIIEGGQTIYFAVYPYFQGKTGTYDFEIQISKSVPKDIYEDNNTLLSAYSVEGTFVGTTKNIKLTGASIHSGSDIDYFKITCPSGLSYSISAYIRDKNYLNNANLTLDGEWSYSTNGSTWSSWMDGAFQGNGTITLNENGTLYIRVKSKTPGEMGSYAVEMDVTKTMVKDNYESNDNLLSSSLIYASFLNNNAVVTTQNASLHNTTDVDFYRIDLPGGHSYTIDNFISDLVSSNDGKSYTIDAKFAISTNGTQWSSYYENVFNGFKINADKPMSIYIKVLPSKINTIGTYRYSANILRGTLTTIADEGTPSYTITKYSNGFTLYNTFNSSVESIAIYTNDGKLYLESRNIDNEYSVSGLPSGLFLLYIRKNDGSISLERLSSVR